MDEEKQRKEEAGIQNEINRIGRDNKKNRSKFSIVANRISKVIAFVAGPLLKMLPFIMIATIICALIDVFTFFILQGDNTTASAASSKVLKDKENVDIVEAIDENGENQGYYFKIDKKIIKNYLEELNRAYHLRILG